MWLIANRCALGFQSSPLPRVAGVCGGFAEYFNLDSTVVRVLWAVATILPGAIVFGIVAYVVAWFIMPSQPARSTRPAAQTA